MDFNNPAKLSLIFTKSSRESDTGDVNIITMRLNIFSWRINQIET